MQRYKNEFQALHQILAHVGVQITALNKAAPRANSFIERGHNLGVAADHIKVYNLHRYRNFAFAFHYQGKSPAQITTTMKTAMTPNSEAAWEEQTFTLEEFGPYLRQFLKTLQAAEDLLSLSTATVDQAFYNVFIKRKLAHVCAG